MGPELPVVVRRVVTSARARLGGAYRATYVWGSHARGDAIETSDVDVGVFVRGAMGREARERLEQEIEAEMGEPNLDFAVVAESDLDGRDAVSLRCGALRVDGDDLRESVPLPGREEWTDLAEEAALWFVARSRPAPLSLPLVPFREGDEFLGYVCRTIRIGDRDLPLTKEALSVAGRVATARVARVSGRFVGDRPQAIRAFAEDVGGAWAGFLTELQESLRGRWRYLVPEAPAERARLRELCTQTLAFEREFVDRVATGPRGPRTDAHWRDVTTAATPTAG
jgi:predicted nucleotidyltransferase